jgi:hypothetical protein
VYRPSPGLAWQMIAGEAILLDIESGWAVGLNEVGSFVWSQIGEKTEEEIAEAVAAVYEVDGAEARRDIAAFTSLLRARGLLADGP